MVDVSALAVQMPEQTVVQVEEAQEQAQLLLGQELLDKVITAVPG